MEYCEGGDMNQVVESMQGNKIPEDKIVYWLAQIALAIFYMH
jgi:serine/threonine protein kinase